MKISILLLLCLAFSSTSSSNNRIFGGRNGADGQFPYTTFHVIRNSKGGFNTCTGGLIRPRWVLTVAHCLTLQLDPNKHLVAAGKADFNDYIRIRNSSGVPFNTDLDEAVLDLQERRVEALFPHPKFKGDGTGFDIGLMKLQRAFVFNNRVSALSLPKKPFKPASNCVITGYGISESNIRTNIIQYITGVSANPSKLCDFGKNKDVICLADLSRGICKGDSGGPLVCGKSISGVASLGISDQPGCGKGVKEWQFTDVHKNLGWIDRILASNR